MWLLFVYVSWAICLQASPFLNSEINQSVSSYEKQFDQENRVQTKDEMYMYDGPRNESNSYTSTLYSADPADEMWTSTEPSADIPQRETLTHLKMMACLEQSARPTKTPCDGEFSIDWCQNITQILKHVTADVCGASTLCNRVPERRDCDFGCHPCKCDPICHVHRDCCLDIQEEQLSKPVSNSQCVESGWRLFAYESRARMVTRCPSNPVPKPDVVRKCEQPDNSVLEEATPVSDNTSGLTYQNEFCAQCNNVKNHSDWKYEVSCQFASKLYEVATEEELWPKVISEGSECRINAFPPAGITVHSRCQSSDVGTCNVTGMWAGPNVGLMEKLCDRYEHAVKHQSIRYRNLFCAICNGIKIVPRSDNRCLSRGPPPIYPLSVLLDFSPRKERMDIPVLPASCSNGAVIDPFSKECVRLSCQENQLLRAGRCQRLLPSTRGLGYSITLLLTRVAGELQLPDDVNGTQFLVLLQKLFRDNFEGVIVNSMQLRFFLGNITNSTDSDRVLLTVQLAFTSIINFDDLETLLHNVENMNFTSTQAQLNETTFTSTSVHCPINENQLTNDTIDINTSPEATAKKLVTLCRFFRYNCLENFVYISPPIQPECPYVEYNLSTQNFSYDMTSGRVMFEGKSITLNQSRLFLCGDVMRVCSDLVAEMREFFAQSPSAVDVDFSADVVLSWLSLVCLSLSLLGLLLTFLVYSCLPKLRNLPGKITMLLVVHLFVAILLFLLGSRRQSDGLVCKIMAVGIHYFWMTVFGWMMIAAYHMYKVFARLSLIAADTKDKGMRALGGYFVFCHSSSTLVVGGCVAFNFLQSQHSGIGYGGAVCFIRHPLSNGLFFAVPLGVMLLFNLICFVRTIFAIRSVPNMANVSNSTNRHYVFVYVKIAVLLGFSWVFGLQGALTGSLVIQYLFVVLTGCQGILIFIGYCMTGRSREMLKQKFIPEAISFSSKATSVKSP